MEFLFTTQQIDLGCIVYILVIIVVESLFIVSRITRMAARRVASTNVARAHRNVHRGVQMQQARRYFLERNFV